MNDPNSPTTSPYDWREYEHPQCHRRGEEARAYWEMRFKLAYGSNFRPLNIRPAIPDGTCIACGRPLT